MFFLALNAFNTLQCENLRFLELLHGFSVFYIHTYFIRPKRAFRNKDTLIKIKLKNIFTTQLIN